MLRSDWACFCSAVAAPDGCPPLLPEFKRSIIRTRGRVESFPHVFITEQIAIVIEWFDGFGDVNGGEPRQADRSSMVPKIHRRKFLKGAAAWMTANQVCSEALSSMAQSSRPVNVIFVTTHDSGRHFGCYGVQSAPTPNIDRLASEGMRFDQMFSVCSICSPSRAARMTGYYPHQNGVMGFRYPCWSRRSPVGHGPIPS